MISLISSQPKNLGIGLWQDSLKFVIKITTEDLKHQKFELSLIKECVSTGEHYFLTLGDIQEKSFYSIPPTCLTVSLGVNYEKLEKGTL